MNKKQLLKALEIFDDEQNVFVCLETRTDEKDVYECHEIINIEENMDEVQINITKDLRTLNKEVQE